jgi:hypothetical protein
MGMGLAWHGPGPTAAKARPRATMARWLWSRRSDDYRLSRSFALILLALGIERPHWPELQQSRLLRSEFTKVEFGPPVNVRGSLPK